MPAKNKPTGKLVLQTLAMPANTNANGDIFGGWLVSQLDLGAGILAKHIAQSRTVTVAIDSLVFKQPVHVGDIVSCYAKLLKLGNTSITIHMEAWSMAVEEEKANFVTKGIFTFVAVNKAGKPWAADPKKR